MSRLESLLMNLMWHGSWRSRVMEVFPVIRWVSVMLVNSEDWPQKKNKTKNRFNLTHRHEHRHTDEQTRVTVSDSPVHGAALSPFSLEDQIPPDQLRDREKDGGEDEWDKTQPLLWVCVDLVWRLTLYLRQRLSFSGAPAGRTDTMRNRDRGLAGKRHKDSQEAVETRGLHCTLQT